MRIQHNIMAMNAYRNYNTNTSALSKNLEKLSSGYKINRAGDDAADLAISEKMRAQITGLTAAQKNVKDGVSLVKTAEGAMQEIQDMLNRMDYLATQSANGTYDDPVDRQNLQKEVDALKSEINRIADSSNFNGIKLLDGSLGEGKSTTTVTGLKDIATLTNKFDAQLAGPEAQAGKWELDLSEYTFTSTDKSSQILIKSGTAVLATVTIAGTSSTAMKDAKVDVAKDGTILLGGASVNVSYDESTGKLTVEMAKAPTTTNATAAAKGTGMPGGANLKISFDAAANSTAAKMTIQVSKGTGTAAALGDINVGLKTVQEAVVKGDDRLLAHAEFTLSDSDVADGMTLKIGNESYTFAVGADSKFKGGKNVIDLTDMTAEDIKKDLAGTAPESHGKVINRITQAFANNSQFQVTTDMTDGAKNKIVLNEKMDSGLDYLGSAIVGEKSEKGSKDDASWKGIVQIGKGTVSTASSGGLRLQIGDTADKFNQLNVLVGDMHTNAMGTGKTTLDGEEIEVTKTIADVDISNQDGAAEAIGIIKNAINYVSGIRGDLGAIQNRLEHTQKNLSVMTENIQDAESTIRDTDVAEEMMSYTKNNILIQSAQAMLAQANAVPQGVLQLLG